MLDPYLGQIQLFAFGYVPIGYRLCDGAILTIQGNEALFSLIRNEFGGNGTTNFALPNLTAAVPLKINPGFMCYYIAVQGIYPSRG